MVAFGGSDPIDGGMLATVDVNDDATPTMIYTSMTDWSDLGIDNFTHTPLTQTQKTELGNNLKILTRDATCASLISKVLETLKSTGNAAYNSTDITEVFRAISEDRTAIWESVNFSELNGGANAEAHVVPTNRVDGSVAYRHITMQFDTWFYGYTPHSYAVQPTAYERAAVLVHELFHAFGNNGIFTHGQIASAISSSVSALKISGVGAEPNEKDFIDSKTGKLNAGKLDFANGRYITTAITQACKGGE